LLICASLKREKFTGLSQLLPLAGGPGSAMCVSVAAWAFGVEPQCHQMYWSSGSKPGWLRQPDTW
jgi:hypothetical protein